MGTPSSLRLRVVFEDRSILSKTQRSDGMNNSWLLLKSQQHPTISDICTHLVNIFKLRRSCPNGILLSMEGFTLPPFESTEILKDKEIICVKKKGGITSDAGNLIDEAEDDELEPGDNGLLLLENDKAVHAGEDQSTSEDFDEEQSQDEELPEEAISKKRKASTNLANSKKKRLCVGVLDDDEDETETKEIEKVKDASHPIKISSKKGTKIKAATSNKKVNSPSVVKRSEDLQENVEEVNQVSNAPEAKKLPSRSARRKKAKRQWMRELAKIGKKKPQANSKPEVIKHKNEEANGQPKGLLYWKQASKNPEQNGDVGPVVTRPGHFRFEPYGDQAAKQTGVSYGTCKRNCSSSKRKGQQWGREKFLNFKKNESKRINKELFKTLFKDSQVPVIDVNDFDKLPPCSEPKEGDVIAYRLLELNSSWIPEFSSFRVGRISYYDAKDIVLIPVPEYPIDSEQIKDNGPNDSLYGEDGSLEINYSALVDVRNIMQHDPDAMETVNNGVSQTPPSKEAAETLMSNINDNNVAVPKDNTPGKGEVSPWDHFSSKNTETPEPNRSGLNPSTYGGPGPSTSTCPDADKPESSGVKDGQNGNSFDPWLAANTPDRVQEKNTSWSDVKQKAPAENGCENGSSWGRPWSAFVVSRSSSVIQADKENDWRGGSSRGSGKPWSRGAPRGRGRGQNRGRGRGRNW